MQNRENDHENENSYVSALTSNTSVKDEDIVRATSNGGKNLEDIERLQRFHA